MTPDTTHDEKPGATVTSAPKKEFDWFDKPESRRFLWKLLWGACIVTVALEIPLIIAGKRHSHFETATHAGGDHSHADHVGAAATGAASAASEAAHHVPTFDGWWFFYPILGFVGCALMILAAKGLGFWLKKPEDYYGDDGEKTLPEDIDESLR